MTRDEFCKICWNYFRVLESDMLAIERFVEFDLGDNSLYDEHTVSDVGNSNCFSNEFVKQYLAICSEVDVILKAICREINSQSTAGNMPEYTTEILQQTMWSELPRQIVEVKSSGIVLNPFFNWSFCPYCAPKWFKMYNYVKHNRQNYYKHANLKNTLNALAGLYLLEIYFVKYIADKNNKISKENHTWMVSTDVYDVPNDVSKLFTAVNFETEHTVVGYDSYITTFDEIDELIV